MGSGIAEVCARHGLDVCVVDADDASVKAGRERIEASLAHHGPTGEARRRHRGASPRVVLTFSTDLGTLSECHLVVEAVTESEPVKTDIFRSLDQVVDSPEAILASNTSSIPIMKLGMATRRPANVVGLHFFNPVPVLPLVELVSSLVTSPETTERAAGFATDVLGKHVIRSQDRAGFIVNAFLIPYLLSAIRMLESGFATAEDIDTGMVQRLRPPDGTARPHPRPHRPGHHHGGRRLALRRIQGAPLRPAASPEPDGRGGPARPQVGPWLSTHDTPRA